MKTRLLTVKTDDQEAYELLLSNWLAADASIIQCGFDNRDLTWWAIAKIEPTAPEKPCDIIMKTIRRSEFPCHILDKSPAKKPAKRAARKSRLVTCQECGKGFFTKGTRTKYCAKCKRLKMNAYLRNYRNKKAKEA